MASKLTPVDVVIPFFRGGDWIARAVDSVRHQGHPTRVIVVNDGSPTTHGLVGLDLDLRIDQSNAGTAAARNAGLAACTAELVTFLDSDDHWLSGKLDAHLPALLAGADVVHGGVRFVDERDCLLSEWLRPASDTVADLIRWCEVMVQTVIMRRSVLERVGWLDETLSGADDWDLWIRLGAAGARFATVRTVHTAMLGHLRQQSLSIGSHHEAMRRVIDKHAHLAPDAARLARRRLAADRYAKQRHVARQAHGWRRAVLNAQALAGHPGALVATPRHHLRRLLGQP